MPTASLDDNTLAHIGGWVSHAIAVNYVLRLKWSDSVPAENAMPSPYIWIYADKQIHPLIEGEVMKALIKSKIKAIKPALRKPKFRLLTNFITFIVILFTVLFVVSLYF